VFKISVSNINTWLSATKKGLPCSFKHSRDVANCFRHFHNSQSQFRFSFNLVYPFSTSSSKTVGFRILVLLTFSAYFGVINHSTNFHFWIPCIWQLLSYFSTYFPCEDDFDATSKGIFQKTKVLIKFSLHYIMNLHKQNLL